MAPSSAIFTISGDFLDGGPMAVTTAKRKSSPPPEPKAWKDKPVNAEYEDKAKALLREHLEKTGNDYASLTEKLNSMGLEIRSAEAASRRRSYCSVLRR